MTDKIVLFHTKMTHIMDEQKNMNDSDSLKSTKIFMNDEVFPFLEQFMNEAIAYRKKRDKRNIKLIKLMKSQYKSISNKLKKLKYVQVIIMSSIAARLNLATNDSDIDFGIVVNDLNNKNGKSIDIHKYTQIVQILNKNKFYFSGILNPDNLSNQYFSFEQKIKGIDFELKIRDYNASKPVIELHKFLDTKLTEKQITLLTYAKYLFKQFDKNNSNFSYNKFKSILYNWAFSYIKGGFKLNL